MTQMAREPAIHVTARLSKTRVSADRCVMIDCERDAEVRGMCKKCRGNYLYHVNQGPVHIAVWVKQVRLKVSRAKYMEKNA